MGSPSWIIEKKFVEGQKGNDITPFDGTVLHSYVSTLVMSMIPKRKHKVSDIEANYRNENKTFCGPHTIRTKAKHFDFV